MITDEMVERAARALFDESPDMLDAGWEASPEKDIYRKAATAALSAAEQEPKRVERKEVLQEAEKRYRAQIGDGGLIPCEYNALSAGVDAALSAALSSEAQEDQS